MTLTTFLANVVEALEVISPDWNVWVVGALAIGTAARFGPRIVKRFM